MRVCACVYPRSKFDLVDPFLQNLEYTRTPYVFNLLQLVITRRTLANFGGFADTGAT